MNTMMKHAGPAAALAALAALPARAQDTTEEAAAALAP